MPGPKNNPPADAGSKPLHKDAAAKKYWQDTFNAAHAPDSSGLTGVSAAAAKYPLFGAMMGIPEVADLLNQASLEGWTNDQFQLHLMATKWWKSTSDSERNWQVAKLSNPGQAAQLKAQKIAEVTAEAGKLGVRLDPNQIDFIAEGALGGGWDQTILQNAIAGNAQRAADRPGQIAATQTQLDTVAASYGIPVSKDTTFAWAKKIAMGTADASGFGEYAKDQAKISHPYWEKQLDQGLTVRQLADPYLQTASRLLEVAPDQIDLSSHKWSNAFVAQHKDGTQAPMSQLDWSKKLMTDSAYGWDRTANAKDAAFQIQNQLRQSFGAV